MRPHRISTVHWLSLLLIDLISYGLTENYNNQDFTKILSVPKKSLMEIMIKKYSYPKNEVTAGVGYGGEKKMMYPCAVECGEWETMMDADDSVNDASSNIDVVTVRPDVNSIEITTPKSRPYKDASLLRLNKNNNNNNKYKSTTPFPPVITSPNTLYHSSNNYEDSKGADVKIIPHKANNEYVKDDRNKVNNDDKNESNDDGSLYGKYHSALINGYEGELTEYGENKNREYYDPVVESIRYNPPSFNDEDESEDSNRDDGKFHPKRERIEEKYVKHNLREERLEDVRTNSFGGSSDENDDYSTDSDDGYGNQSGNYEPQKYLDDYPSEPKPNSQSVPVSGKPFKPSPPQGGKRYPPIRNGRHRERNEYPAAYRGPQNQEYLGGGGGYSNYDYGEEDRDKESSSVLRANEAHFNPTNHLNHQQDKRIIQNCAKKDPLTKFPASNSHGGYKFRGRYKEYPLVSNINVAAAAGHSGRHPKPDNYYNSYYGKKNAFIENVSGPYSYHPYAPRHGYSPESQESLSPTRLGSGGGIRIVNSPQIIIPYKHNLPSRHGRYPHRYKNGLAPLPVQNPVPRIRGHRISYREIIPQRDGFTKIVKRYKTFVDHTPKRYVSSGEPYARLI